MRRARGLPYGADVAAVLPALDPAGNLTYVQARYLHPDATGRKYDNPAAALAPHPRLAFPAATGQRAGVLLVCEGIPDALTAAQAGYRSVALLGAHTPDPAVAARLANHATNLGLDVAIVCDPDPAGRHVADTPHRPARRPRHPPHRDHAARRVRRQRLGAHRPGLGAQPSTSTSAPARR